MLSFLYLGLREVFELLILLGRSADRKEFESLVLRHELSVLRRQAKPPRYGPADRALLAALSRALPRQRWSAFAVTAETLLRWHRVIVKRRWTYARRAPGRPPLDAECVALILRLARENPRWGYRRIVGELKKLGLSVSETSVRNLLRRRGVPPAPRRSRLSWRAFLRPAWRPAPRIRARSVTTGFMRPTGRVDRVVGCDELDGERECALARSQGLRDRGDDPVGPVCGLQAGRLGEHARRPLPAHEHGAARLPPNPV